MNRQILLALAAAVVAGSYLFATWALPTLSLGDPVGQKLFPALIGALMLAASGLLLFNACRRRRAVASDGPPPADSEDRPVAVLLVWLWLISIVVAFEILGFALSGMIFMGGFLSYFHRGRHGINAAIAIFVPLGVYLVFKRMLGIPLPPGVLWF